MTENELLIQIKYDSASNNPDVFTGTFPDPNTPNDVSDDKVIVTNGSFCV